MNKRHAFTLIEMLVVIAIIGIIAAMVAGMAGHAKTAQRNAQVTAGKNTLLLMIDSYKSKLNFYPPDNGNLANTNLNNNYALNYDGWAATNPLLYELTGASNSQDNTQMILLFDGTNVDSVTFSNTYARSSVANANTDEPHSFYLPPTKEYTNYSTGFQLKGLVVPVVSSLTNSMTNFWHYDASSPNRHNLTGYDLWAEYISGSKSGTDIITTNGNW